jgi:hypothetical protein
MKSGLIFTILACLLLSMLYCPPVDVWYDDKQIFRYAGLLLYKGGVPYRDLFDHKPPLIYFFNYAGLLLGTWGLWIIDTLLVSGATLLFYRLCRQKCLPYAPILPLFFNLLIRNYLVCEGIGMTRAYTAIFLLMAFCVLMGRSRYKFFWLGLISGATLLMQQDQLLTLLPFLVYAFFAGPTDLSSSTQGRPNSNTGPTDPSPSTPGLPSWRSLPDLSPAPTHAFIPPRWPLLLRRSLPYAAGFAVILFPILLYFGLHNALTAFWQDAFRFNFSWYAEKKPLVEHIRAIKAGLKESDNEMPFVLSLGLGITALLLKTRNKGLLAAALLATLFAFGPESFSGRLSIGGLNFYYYLLPLSAALPIIVFLVWTNTGENFLRDKKSHALFGCLLCFPLLYNAVQHATHLPRYSANVVSTSPEYQYLRRQPLADYQLYILGNNNWAYAYDECRILSPSPWIYHHFWGWYDRWDHDHKILASIGQDLLRHRTRFVMDFSDTGTFLDPAAYAFWKSFLYEHYQPVLLPGRSNVLLWQLNPMSANTQP